MPLYNETYGYYSSVLTDLYYICNQDGGLGDTPVPGDTTVMQITYNQNMSSSGCNRLNDIVNHTTNYIVVGGVDSTFTINGVYITNYAGITYIEPSNTSIIRIYYDTFQCNGNGYHVFDSGSNPISFPGYILCFHELAHAFRIDHGLPFGEVEASTDENSLRQEDGLPLRDPNNHNGGCGSGAGGGGDTNCFIVSAVSGPGNTGRLNGLRRLRDLYLRRSALGAGFFGALWDEYYQFSPAIAADIRSSAVLRPLVSILCVEPLLRFFELLDHYLSEGWKMEDSTDKLNRVVQRFLEDTSRTGLRADAILSMPAILGQLKEYLQLDPGDGRKEPLVISSGHDTADSVLEYLAAIVSSKLSEVRFITWGILEPVIFFWRLAGERAEAAASRGGYPAPHFPQWVDAWLSEVPIPHGFEKLDEEEMRASLAQLAATVFTVPVVRKRFGERFTAQYGGLVTYDLSAVLQETGYCASGRRPE